MPDRDRDTAIPSISMDNAKTNDMKDRMERRAKWQDKVQSCTLTNDNDDVNADVDVDDADDVNGDDGIDNDSKQQQTNTAWGNAATNVDDDNVFMGLVKSRVDNDNVPSDDLFPTLGNDNSSSSNIINNEEEQPSQFDEARSKIGNLIGPQQQHQHQEAHSCDDDDAKNSSPIGLPATTATTTTMTKRKRRPPHTTGLGNLGNTCFLNSTLQCLAHTPPLRHSFLSGNYKKDLNVDNPLGTGGDLANEFAVLMGMMWGMDIENNNDDSNIKGGSYGGDEKKDAGIYSSSRIYSPGNGGAYPNANTNSSKSYSSMNTNSVTYPRSFKTTLGTHAPSFSGYDQHDSQELAIYLLDALHEDTNRICKKPYVEKPEMEEGESDDQAAQKAWMALKQREDSSVLESFMGLVKSRVSCPKGNLLNLNASDDNDIDNGQEDETENNGGCGMASEGQVCGRVSTTFDPCMYLSVPIPGCTDRTMTVIFVPLPSTAAAGTGTMANMTTTTCTAAELTIKLDKNSTMATLQSHVIKLARQAYTLPSTGVSALLEEDVLLTDIFQQKVWRYLDKDDYCIDGIKDGDVVVAYQLYPKARVQEEVQQFQKRREEEDRQSIRALEEEEAEKEKQSEKEKQQAEERDVDNSKSTVASTTAAATAAATATVLSPQHKSTLDNDNQWETTLSAHLSQPHSLYHILNESRSSHEERLAFYRKLLRFIQRLKTCSDATATAVGSGTHDDNADAGDDDGKQTLEEVSYTCSQFKSVRTPLDLAILEYCACKFMTHVNDIKNGKSTRENNDRKKMDDGSSMSEDGIVVQIKIKKSDTSPSYYGNSSSTCNSSSVSRYSWKVVGDYPIVARISPTLTVQGLRQMLGRRLSSALKLNNDIVDDRHDAAQIHVPESSSLSISPEMRIMNQVALSCENKDAGGRSNNRYHHNNNGNGNDNGTELGSVAMDHLVEKNNNAVATSNDKGETELVANIVENEGIIIVSWPCHLNDVFEEDLFFAKDDYWTEEQTKARKEEEDDDSNSTGTTKKKKSNNISIMDCISKYCETEQLDETDMWYCSKCQEHVRAWKQFHLYRTPPILIVHLKRFHFSSTTHRRDKIDTLIDFPLVDLDLRGVVSQWDEKGKEDNDDDEDPPPVYDCYAVSNHFGGLGGGHYTAYAKGDDGVWRNFDDSRVTPVGDESEVVSSAAYCLYYKRKDVGLGDIDDDNDDDVMSKENDDVDDGRCCLDQQGMTTIPVSPVGVSRRDRHDNDNDNMEVDSNNQEDDGSANTGSAASYKTPTSLSCNDTDDGIAMDGDDADGTTAPALLWPDPTDDYETKKQDVFYDLQ